MIWTLPLALCQTVAAAQVMPAPAFAVASVKPIKGFVRPQPHTLRGGIWLEAATLKDLIGLAYETSTVQIRGGPSFVDSEKYEVHAKAESGDASWEQVRGMLQTLLADRFKLALHHETKESSVYWLTVRNGGPKLQVAGDGETHASRGSGWGKIAVQNGTIENLTKVLTVWVGAPVIDKTGLGGRYDIKLSWTPDQDQFRRFATSRAGASAQSVDSGPSLYTSIEEQLGLKLEAKKGPIDTILIDHAEPASPN